MSNQPQVTLAPLEPDDKEQFILDNQWAFKYGATEEFGVRDDHFEEDGEIISRDTIEQSINNGKAYRILLDGEKVGGVVVSIDKAFLRGELELLFVKPDAHSKGIGYAAWCLIEKMYPEIYCLGDLHTLFREAQHPFLCQQMRFSYRGIYVER